MDWSTIGTWVQAISAGGLAYLTWVLKNEAKDTREMQLAPNVVGTIEVGEASTSQAFFLVLHNLGHGSAYNITITATPDFSADWCGLAKYKYFNKIKLPDSLRPGQIYRHMLDITSVVIKEGIIPEQLAIETSFVDNRGKRYKTLFNFSADLYRNTIPGQTAIACLAQSLKKMQDSSDKMLIEIKSIATSLKKIENNNETAKYIDEA